jgi:hypothetical protein
MSRADRLLSPQAGAGHMIVDAQRAVRPFDSWGFFPARFPRPAALPPLLLGAAVAGALAISLPAEAVVLGPGGAKLPSIKFVWGSCGQVDTLHFSCQNRPPGLRRRPGRR